MCRFHLWMSLWLVVFTCLLLGTSSAEELDGVMVRLDKYEGPATIVAQSVGPYKLRVTVEPRGEGEPLTIRVELPASGRNVWPAADVEVRDTRGQALAVRRSGIEWHRLLIPVPAIDETYIVQSVDLPGDRPTLPGEKERQLTDKATGLSLTIARWYNGRQAALSIRFDDSHPSHLSTAIPILREYGFRGTFMINPGEREPNSRRGSSFDEHRGEWEACAQRGDQEFANHSAHHRGAVGDTDMDAEIGEAAKAIWELFPGKSKLTALNLGGGTLWETTRTLRYYLDKYHLFDASQNSMGMDDSYGNRVARFHGTLEQHIQRGLWCRIHYHSIGEGLACSEENFRAVLDIAKENESVLWIAGMADIYKYQSERRSSALSLVKSDPHHLSFKLSCFTNPELYDQPLTIEVTPPESWPLDRIAVTDVQGKAVAFRTTQLSGQTTLRLELAPHSAIYTIRWKP